MKWSQRWNNLQICPHWYSNLGGSDLWSNTLLLDHRGACIVVMNIELRNHWFMPNICSVYLQKIMNCEIGWTVFCRLTPFISMKTVICKARKSLCGTQIFKMLVNAAQPCLHISWLCIAFHYSQSPPYLFFINGLNIQTSCNVITELSLIPKFLVKCLVMAC